MTATAPDDELILVALLPHQRELVERLLDTRDIDLAGPLPDLRSEHPADIYILSPREGT